jgi:hypothetical protein
LHTCAHNYHYIIKKFSYLFSSHIICYDLISVSAINKLQEIKYSWENITFWYNASSYCF